MKRLIRACPCMRGQWPHFFSFFLYTLGVERWDFVVAIHLALNLPWSTRDGFWVNSVIEHLLNSAFLGKLKSNFFEKICFLMCLCTFLDTWQTLDWHSCLDPRNIHPWVAAENGWRAACRAPTEDNHVTNVTTVLDETTASNGVSCSSQTEVQGASWCWTVYG